VHSEHETIDRAGFSFPAGSNLGDTTMRALCGAIITAGALIGLGLTALAFGTRYEHVPAATAAVAAAEAPRMDPPLVFVLLFLTLAALIGFGISFLGLAYHHHRLHHEFLRQQGGVAGSHGL
jgi:hypothetical protein